MVAMISVLVNMRWGFMKRRFCSLAPPSPSKEFLDGKGLPGKVHALFGNAFGALGGLSVIRQLIEEALIFHVLEMAGNKVLTIVR